MLVSEFFKISNRFCCKKILKKPNFAQSLFNLNWPHIYSKPCHSLKFYCQKSSQSYINQESDKINVLSDQLKTMFFSKISSSGREELRKALKVFKQVIPKDSALIMMNLTKYSNSIEIKNEKQIHNEKLAYIESLARLVEISINLKDLPLVLLNLSQIYPEWLEDGWIQILECLIQNKGGDLDSFVAILESIPRNICADYSISLFRSDLIVQYQSFWSQDSELKTFCNSKSRFQASQYGRLISKFLESSQDYSMASKIVAHMTLANFENLKLQIKMHPTELFINTLFFNIVVISSFVEHSPYLTTKEIEQTLQILNLKVLAYLKKHEYLVESAFNTYEYLEWVTFLISESSKRRNKKFNDYFLIKDCLKTLLDQWCHDDIDMVSQSIGERFTIKIWLRQKLEFFLKRQKPFILK